MNEQNDIKSNTPVEYNTTLNNLNETPTPKKNPVGGIIIALLVLVILGLVCYIAYDKGYLDKLVSKEEPKQQEKQETQEEKDIAVIKDKIEKIDFSQLIIAEFDNSEHQYINDRIASLFEYIFKTNNGKKLTLEEYYEMIKCDSDNCKNHESAPVTVLDGKLIKDYYEEFYGKLPDNYEYVSINRVGEYDYNGYSDGQNYYIAKYKPEYENLIGYPVAYYEVFKYNEEYTSDDNYYYLTFNYTLLKHDQEYVNDKWGEWYIETYNGVNDLLNSDQTIEHPERRNITIDNEKSKELPRIKVYIKKDEKLNIEKIELLDEKIK